VRSVIAAVLPLLVACGSPPAAEAPTVAPVATIADPPSVAPDASAPSVRAVEPPPTEPELAVELRDGVAQVRGQGFEPGLRIRVSLDEYEEKYGYGPCRGDELEVTATARGVFRARLHLPPCAALLCTGWRHAVGVSADWDCGSDCRAGLVVAACPGGAG